jgi:hypothetical protein
MYVVHVIEVRERGEGGVLIELRGEFDGHNLGDLRQPWTPWWRCGARRWWTYQG